MTAWIKVDHDGAFARHWWMDAPGYICWHMLQCLCWAETGEVEIAAWEMN
jgi:hypothetical protein